MVAPIAFTAVVLDTPLLARTAAFYEEHFGLLVAKRSDDHVAFSPEQADRPALHLRAGASPRLAELSFAVESDDAFARFERQFRSIGVESRREEGDLLVTAPDGWTIRLHVGRDVSGVDVPSDAVRPAFLSHAVINSTDSGDLVEFLTRGLGMTVSDSYEKDLLVFLKCAQPQHHCLGVAPATTCGLNHFAVDCGSIDVLMRGVSRMKAAGYEPIWGPGRHGPGGNVFCYFEDPTGFVPEFTCEVLQIADGAEWQPSVWQRSPANGNVWLSGGPSARAVELMGGEGMPGRAAALAAETTE